MKSKENNRGFGLLFFIVFLLIALWPVLKGDNPRIYFFPIAILFLILGIINSKILTPLNKLWIKFGEQLGKVIAPNLIHNLFKGVKILELIIPKIKNKIAIGKKYILGLSPFNTGHKAIRRKTIKNNRPKPLLFSLDFIKYF
jgi:hypothetical protein